MRANIWNEFSATKVIEENDTPAAGGERHKMLSHCTGKTTPQAAATRVRKKVRAIARGWVGQRVHKSSYIPDAARPALQETPKVSILGLALLIRLLFLVLLLILFPLLLLLALLLPYLELFLLLSPARNEQWGNRASRM